MSAPIQTGCSTAGESHHVTVVVVSHNCVHHLYTCLSTLIGAGCPEWVHVVVVDNASRDNVRAVLNSAFPYVHLIYNERNVGFACAANQGIRQSVPGSHVLLLNPDAALEQAALRSLLAFLLNNPDAGCVAPRVLDSSGEVQNTARAFPSLWTSLIGRRSVLLRWFPNNRVSAGYLLDASYPGVNAFPVDWVSGACALLRRQAVDQVGLLDEAYLMYWEDADWCQRAKRRGWRIFCLPSVVAVHAEGGSGGTYARLALEFHRSALRYYVKHHLHSFRYALLPAAVLSLAVRFMLVLAATYCRNLICRNGRVRGAIGCDSSAPGQPLTRSKPRWHPRR